MGFHPSDRMASTTKSVGRNEYRREVPGMAEVANIDGAAARNSDSGNSSAWLFERSLDINIT